MKQYKFVTAIPLVGKSLNSINVGHYPLEASYLRIFSEEETNTLRFVTDLDKKVHRRNKMVDTFLDAYYRDFQSKRISMLCVIVKHQFYQRIGKFINSFSRKLKRKGIKRLGYLWVRDIGDNHFERHYHVLIATSPLNIAELPNLLPQPKDERYKFELVKTKTGMHSYIKKKELYAASWERPFGKSRILRKLPKAAICDKEAAHSYA